MKSNRFLLAILKRSCVHDERYTYHLFAPPKRALYEQDREFAVKSLILEFIFIEFSSNINCYNLFCRVTQSDHVFIACPISLIKISMHVTLNVVIFISDVELR